MEARTNKAKKAQQKALRKANSATYDEVSSDELSEEKEERLRKLKQREIQELIEEMMSPQSHFISNFGPSKGMQEQVDQH